MRRPCGLVLTALTIAPAILSLTFANASSGPRRWRDDQIPFGPAGTIGRGTDSAADPPYNVRGGIPLFTFGRSAECNDPGGSSAPMPTCAHEHGFLWPGRHVPPALSGPYPTNQYCEPGDDRRYPLYYNPATNAYFYYPASR
jgi:hypothetical protein